MEIVAKRIGTIPVYEKSVEIVERKGLGHPDSICDALAERSSVALSKFYMEEVGFICHHNLDKGLLVGGIADVRFGGGTIIESPEITVAGTATIVKNEEKVRKIIYDSIVDYLSSNLRFVNKLRPNIFVKIHPGSKDLVAVYNKIRKGSIPLANDTSVGVGIAPQTLLEELVYLLEVFLNSKKVKERFPWIGEDIKVMGIRNNDKINLTLAVAFVSQFIRDLREYYEVKCELTDFIKRKFGRNLNVEVNTADSENDIYLTVTGLSCENGDDGQVGRGNRVNGLITPNRSMSLEAVAGKNPVSHVGKIYNIKANEIANEILRKVKVKEVQVHLVSQIGRPISDPFVNVEYVSDDCIDKREFEEVILSNLSEESFEKLVHRVIEENVRVF